MKFGVREICDVVFKAKSDVKIGAKVFKKGQPVLYIDTAKTSTMEGAATTVYAQGGKGNTRLIAWEGEKTLTFTVEDALLSPVGFAVLSGAGLIKAQSAAEKVHVHMTTNALMDSNGYIDLTDALGSNVIDELAPIFVVKTEGDGSVTGELITVNVVDGGKKLKAEATSQSPVFVDYYVAKAGSTISEIQIDAANFAGYYYVEASTLFRRQEDGVDMPAEITFPNVKIQSNFTFSMASSGDPSTFTFTMDAFPGYTYFDQTKKVLCVIQVIEEVDATETTFNTVMGHSNDEVIEESQADSNTPSVTLVTPATYSAIQIADVTVETGTTGTATLPTITFNPDIITASFDNTDGYSNTGTAGAAGTTTVKQAKIKFTVDDTKLATYNTGKSDEDKIVKDKVQVPTPVIVDWNLIASSG